MTDTLTRTTPTQWVLDPAHSSVEFTVKHLMISTVRGRFDDVRATVLADDEAPERSVVEAEVATASLDTKAADRDEHLRSGDFFDAENHPVISFRSTRVVGGYARPGDRFQVVGDLTLRGIPREIVLDVLYEGRRGDPWGGERAGFRATGDIDRRDWGLTWNQALEAGGVMVSNRIRLELDVQFVRQAA